MELNVITDSRVRPFHCGSQAADWQSANCERCKKNRPEEARFDQFPCAIQRAIGEAYLSDGTVSADIGRRMGFTDPLEFQWACTEVDWTDEWRAEWKRRQTLNYKLRKRWHEARRSLRTMYREKRKKLLWWWREPIAHRECATGKDGCWADWCGWAMDISEKPDSGPARSCIAEGVDGSCWCGQFPRKAE